MGFYVPPQAPMNPFGYQGNPSPNDREPTPENRMKGKWDEGSVEPDLLFIEEVKRTIEAAQNTTVVVKGDSVKTTLRQEIERLGWSYITWATLKANLLFRNKYLIFDSTYKQDPKNRYRVKIIIGYGGVSDYKIMKLVERTVRKPDLPDITDWLIEKWKSLIIVACICVTAFFVCTSWPWPYSGVANIPDNNLKAVINHYYLEADTDARIKYTDLAGIITFSVLNYYTIDDLTGLEHCTYMTAINIRDNNITDISPLANLTNLTDIKLSHNSISDIKPLVDNIGLGSGDVVYLQNNPLSSESINVYIPALEARGVEVYYW